MTTKSFIERKFLKLEVKDPFGNINLGSELTLELLHSRTGGNSSSHRAQIRQAASAVNVLSASKDDFVMLDGRPTKVGYYVLSTDDPPVIIEVWVDNLHINNAIAGYSFTNQADPEVALAKASNAAYASIRREQYRVSGPVFIAEIRKTCQMIKRPAQTLQKFTQQYFSTLSKKKSAITGGRPNSALNKADRVSLKQALADTWLEYSFGVAPLVNDIKGDAESLAKFFLNERRARVSSIGVDQVMHLNADSNSGVGGVAYTRHATEFGERRVTFKIGLNALLSGPASNAQRLAKTFGFVPGEFFPTAWEVVPWSFLLDYFVNINEILSSTYTDTTDVYFVSRSDYDSVQKIWTFSAWPDGQRANYGARYVGVAYPGGATSIKRTSHVARVSGGLHPVRLQFKLPGTTTQALNIAALAVSRNKLQPYY